MKSKELVTILTIAGSVTLFGSWLNENYVEKNLIDRVNLIESFTRKIGATRIENSIVENRLWNIRNLYMQDTTNGELKKMLYKNIIEFQTANLKSYEIANEAYGVLYPLDSAGINERSKNLEELRLGYIN